VDALLPRDRHPRSAGEPGGAYPESEALEALIELVQAHAPLLLARCRAEGPEAHALEFLLARTRSVKTRAVVAG
jgi:hypothetical protein